MIHTNTIEKHKWPPKGFVPT